MQQLSDAFHAFEAKVALQQNQNSSTQSSKANARKENPQPQHFPAWPPNVDQAFLQKLLPENMRSFKDDYNKRFICPVFQFQFNIVMFFIFNMEVERDRYIDFQS